MLTGKDHGVQWACHCGGGLFFVVLIHILFRNCLRRGTLEIIRRTKSSGRRMVTARMNGNSMEWIVHGILGVILKYYATL